MQQRDRIIAGVSAPIAAYAAWSALTADGLTQQLAVLITGLAIAAIGSARAGMRTAGGIAIVLACTITPWVGWFTEEPGTSAAAELTWLVLAMLVAGLSFPVAAYWVAAVVLVTTSTALLVTNDAIPLAASMEVAGLQCLVGALTGIFVWLTAGYERRLERDKAYAESILGTLTDGVIVSDSEGRIRHANPAMRALAPDAVGRAVSEVLGDRSPGATYPDETLNGVPVDIRGERMPASGDVVWVVHDLSDTQELLQARARAETATELAEARAQLAKAARMATAGELAAGIAHDVNNPLTGVIGYTDMLLVHLGREVPDLETMRRMARATRRAADRCTKLVKGLLDVGPDRELPHERVALDEVVARALEIALPRLERRGVTVSDETRPDAFVLGDAIQLERIVLNLLINAGNAIQGTRQPAIGVRIERANDQIVLEVTDNGPGVDAEIADRIFEAFYTTRKEDGGTGLGLSVSRDIATRHGGILELKRRTPGQTCFALTLPAAKASGSGDPQPV